MTRHPGDFDRLERAMEVFAAWDDGGRLASADELLSKHPDLVELLTPLLDDALATVSAESASNDDHPTELGGFRIEHELGRGAMGIVYAARQLALDRMVALKVLRTDARIEPRAVARFRRESELLATLEHPSLVEVLTVGRQDDCEFFAMELVDGVPLNDIVRALASDRPQQLDADRFGSTLDRLLADRSSGPRPAPSTDAANPPTDTGNDTRWHRTFFHIAARIAWQIADALAHAHQTGVLHRDVKSSNILLRRDGRAVLTDFGLAREVGRPSLTQSGEFAGTPYYAAPEQVLGDARDLDGRVDVFALGVVLYELLTLRRPFEGDNSHEVAQAVITREPIDPQTIHRRIPPELAAITLRALEKDPRKRYRSARDLADDLGAFLDDRPVQARKAGPLRRLQRYVRREPWQAALAVVLLAAIPSIAYLAGYLQARAPMLQAGEEELRRQRIDDLLERATMRLELDGREAMPLLQAALALDPTDPDTVGMLVWARCDRGDGMSLDEFERLILPTRLGEREQRQLRVPVLMRLGRRDEAVAIQQDLRAPETAIAAFYYGLFLLARGHEEQRVERFRQAADAFELAVLMSPRRRPLYFNKLAHALGHAGDDARQAQVAAALHRSWPDAAAQQYWSYFAEKDSNASRARQRLQRAIELRGDVATLHYNLGTSLTRSGLDEQAVAPLQRAVEIAPHYAQAHVNLSKALFRTGRTEAALEAIDRALAIAPDDAMFLANRGQYLIGADRLDDAAALFAKALTIEPGQAIALAGSAFLEYRRKGAEACSNYCEQVLEQGHACEQIHRYLAMSLTAQRRYEDAVAAADQGLARWPRSAWLHMRRAYAMRYLDKDEAIAAAERAVQLAPSRSVMHSTLGKVLWHGDCTKAQLQAAAAAFAREAELSPRTGTAYLNCSIAWMRSGETDEAIAWMERVTQELPDWRRGHENHGAILLDAGRLEEAIQVLDASFRRFPDDPGIGYRFAYALHRLAGQQQSGGDEAAGRATARRGLDVLGDRSDQRASELKQQLSALLRERG